MILKYKIEILKTDINVINIQNGKQTIKIWDNCYL